MSQTGPIATRPMLVADGKGGWPPQPVGAGITSVRICSLMAKGMDTMEIAAELKTTEAVIWNALARAGA